MQTVLMQTITRVARIYLGQTQAEFAKAVNLTQPDLCELEQKTEPYGTIFKYQRISEYLGIGVDVLLRNDFTAIPESFFEKFPPQPYKDAGNSENHSLGRKGEELIFQRERDRVAEGYPTLSKLVLPLYKMDVASPGFDILTFDELGVPYAIEVKTSALSTGAFNLTGNEYAAASAYTKAGERYILTTISGFGTDKQSIQDTVYSELRQTYRIQPAAYRCYPLPEPAPITGIAYYRRLRGMTQKEFASRMNMPSCNLSSTVSGNRGLTAANYLKAADILETTVDALLQTYTTLPELDTASRKGKQRHQRYMREHCALCGQKGNTLVLGSTGYGVCNACLSTAGKIAGMESPKKQQAVSSEILTPLEIVAELNRTIIGQDEAKNAISIALWKQQLKAHGMKSVPRSTLLLYGPTGCGKTAIVKEAARIAGLPFIHFDATSLSEAGYKGRDAADMVKDLVRAFADHPHLAHGVILIDEFDKLSARGGEQRDAYSRGTQHSLLRLIEGTEIRVDGKVIHTEDLLFIFGGAFSGIGPQMERRNPIGFGAQPIEKPTRNIDAEDFIAYGMEPELMGRITQRVELEPLSRDDLRRILLNAENSVLRQYQRFFAEQGMELQVSPKRIEELLDEAVATGSGARGLQTAIENMVQPMLFRIAEKTVESAEWIA